LSLNRSYQTIGGPEEQKRDGDGEDQEPRAKLKLKLQSSIGR